MLYYAFLHPYFQFCITVWSCTIQKHLDILIKLQKRAIRTICNKGRRESAQPLMKDLKILSLTELHIYSVQLFVYKFHKGMLPDSFSTFYTYNYDIHGHQTQLSYSLHVPVTSRSRYRSKIIRILGVRIYNYFTKYVDCDCTITTYKIRLKKFMLSNDTTVLLSQLQ